MDTDLLQTVEMVTKAQGEFYRDTPMLLKVLDEITAIRKRLDALNDESRQKA